MAGIPIERESWLRARKLLTPFHLCLKKSSSVKIKQKLFFCKLGCGGVFFSGGGYSEYHFDIFYSLRKWRSVSKRRMIKLITIEKENGLVQLIHADKISKFWENIHILLRLTLFFSQQTFPTESWCRDKCATSSFDCKGRNKGDESVKTLNTFPSHKFGLLFDWVTNPGP